MMRDLARPVAGVLRSALGVNGVSDRLAAIEARLASLSVPPAPVAPPASPPRIDTNMMLHQSRGAMMRQLPAGAQRLVSAGCAGLWYFEWVAQCYGPVPEHVGIEFYMPKPAGLPANVTWIENTASDMAGLADASCDLMISGQNIEHLWADEVAGFLTEAARVVRPGGTLAVDSPNRGITAPLNWSHPEHTVELTPGEMRDLLGLAGFDVTVNAGMWLCRDPRTGRMLPYDPNEPDVDWSQTERLVVARDHPDDCFMWWIEATRAGRPADGAAIASMLADIHAVAWPERLRRMRVGAGTLDGDWVVAAEGVVLFGPYVPLRAGSYVAVFDVEAGADPAGWCEVVAEGTVLTSAPIQPGTGTVRLPFSLPALQFGMEFRCISRGAGFRVRRTVELSDAHANGSTG